MKVTIYTDGAASGNPGPGGYGVVLESSAGHKKELSGGFRRTTNNRMELLAAIVRLKELKSTNVSVTVVSDSKYVVDAMNTGWLNSWVKNGFKDKKNPDRCLPRSKAQSLSQKERASTAKKKKREGAKGKTVVKNTKKAEVKFSEGGLARRKRSIARGCGAVMENRRKQTLYT